MEIFWCLHNCENLKMYDDIKRKLFSFNSKYKYIVLSSGCIFWLWKDILDKHIDQKPSRNKINKKRVKSLISFCREIRIGKLNLIRIYFHDTAREC